MAGGNIREAAEPADVDRVRSARRPAAAADRRGAARDAERREAASRRGPADSAQSRTLGERCISWGNVGPPMLPPTYNANFQILETSEAVVLRHEMVHDTRLIYLDGRPHVGAGVRLLAGDSRARWEGDTLVVDTTNFTNETNFRGSPQTTRQDIFASDALHVVERLTRARRGYHPIPIHRRGCEDLDAALVGRIDAPSLAGSDLRVRVPRGELRACQHPACRPCGRIPTRCGSRSALTRESIQRAALVFLAKNAKISGAPVVSTLP